MADDDDIFEFDENGKPAGIRTPLQPLTEEEIHDVVLIATAANEWEAITLVEMLEDSGIPAMRRSGMIYFGGGGVCEVLVPRKLSDKATDAIAKFRGINSISFIIFWRKQLLHRKKYSLSVVHIPTIWPLQPAPVKCLG